MITRARRRRMLEQGLPDPLGGEEEEATAPSPRAASWWVTGTGVHAYLMGDPIQDYFRYHPERCTSLPGFAAAPERPGGALPREAPGREDAGAACPPLPPFPRPPHGADTTFTQFILRKGLQFEAKVMEELYTVLPAGTIVDMGGGGPLGSYSQTKAAATRAALARGVPVIYQGVLRDEAHGLVGSPDLLVRTDWVHRLVGGRHDRVPPVLRSWEGPPSYVVVDVKFMTLPLAADGVHLLNTGWIRAYKGQLWVYTRALHTTLAGLRACSGPPPACAFLMGRGWTHKQLNARAWTPFSRLGLIDYTGRDADIPGATRDAIAWVRAVRREGGTWSIDTVPPSHPCLYPNMGSALHDEAIRPAKEALAARQRELTLLWRVGPKQRARAHARGVYTYDDPRLTPEVMGWDAGTPTARTLAQIIRANRGGCGAGVPRPPPHLHVRPAHGLECFLDFETMNTGIVGDGAEWGVPDVEYIFMIGVGHTSPDRPGWTYRCFTMKELSGEGERAMLAAFSTYLETLARAHHVPVRAIPVYHWSPAEPRHWDRVFARHAADDDDEEEGRLVIPTFRDLAEVFLNTPVVVPGCFSFRLKDVAKQLHAGGALPSTWDVTNPCTSGMTALMLAHRAYEQSAAREVCVTESGIMRDIREYNEMDCRVLWEILTWLRDG